MNDAQLMIEDCNEAIANLKKAIACASNFPNSKEELQISLMKALERINEVAEFALDYDDSEDEEDEEECF